MSKFVTTPERRANLVQLARFLYTEPIEASQFRMGSFIDSDCQYATKLRSCGTAGCAVGWAPQAGIKAHRREFYWNYCNRTLIDEEASLDEWIWCFGPSWADYDNTPRGASKRILWLLVNGLPDDSVAEPALYADWTPTEADWQEAAKCT